MRQEADEHLGARSRHDACRVGSPIGFRSGLFEIPVGGRRRQALE
jgi:hypothetical protein